MMRKGETLVGVDINQLTKSFEIAKHYSDSELDNAEKRISTLIQALYEVIKNERNDPLHVLTENVGLEDTPIGHILTFMGTKPPKHYLSCDGSIYNIADFPMLSQHMVDQFGSVNHFGGDGEATFAVPDLRGEFLRGTGENSRDGQGSGSEVGAHQDATTVPNINTRMTRKGTGLIWFEKNKESTDNDDISTNIDMRIMDHSNNIYQACYDSSYVQNASSAWGTKGAMTSYTTRPTNTSVLYCIKYEPTYYLRAGSDTDYYSQEETCIGTYIDGKPLYRKYYDLSTISITGREVQVAAPGDLDTFVNASVRMLNYTSEGVYVANSPYAQFFGDEQGNYNISTVYNKDTNQISIMIGPAWLSHGKFDYMFLNYTKTT